MKEKERNLFELGIPSFFTAGFEAWEKPGDRIKDAARNGIKEESVGN